MGNTEKLKKILDKQRNNKRLTNKEQILLHNSISTAHQQFIKWYQLNNHTFNVQQRTLTPNQIAAMQQQQQINLRQIQLQQQQILLAQQQQQHQLTANNSPWITSNHYPMDPMQAQTQRVNAPISNAYIHASHQFYNNTNSYFGLPSDIESDRILYNVHNHQTSADKLITLKSQHQTNANSMQ